MSLNLWYIWFDDKLPFPLSENLLAAIRHRKKESLVFSSGNSETAELKQVVPVIIIKVQVKYSAGLVHAGSLQRLSYPKGTTASINSMNYLHQGGDVFTICLLLNVPGITQDY